MNRRRARLSSSRRQRARQAEFGGDRVGVVARRSRPAAGFARRAAGSAARRASRALRSQRSRRVRTAAPASGSRSAARRSRTKPERVRRRLGRRASRRSRPRPRSARRSIAARPAPRRRGVAVHAPTSRLASRPDVDQDPIPAARFGLVELGVGAPDQVLRRFAGAQSRDAERSGDGADAARRWRRPPIACLSSCCLNLVDDRRRVGELGVGKEDGELLAAEPRHLVVALMLVVSSSANSFSTMSPAMCPNLSLIFLKWSMSASATHSVAAEIARLRDLLGQRVVEEAAIAERRSARRDCRSPRPC